MLISGRPYLMAKDMAQSLKDSNFGLDISVKEMHKEIRQVKDTTQSVLTVMIHILHELAHIWHKLPPGALHHPPKEVAGGLFPTLEN